MSKGIYRTAMGQMIDMDNLRLQNERQPAIGNMNVNARGDDILPNGTIIKPRNQKMREHYTEPVVRYNPNKRSAAIQPDVPAETPEVKVAQVVEDVEDTTESVINKISTPPVQKQTKSTKEK